jgi:hypothetical protein
MTVVRLHHHAPEAQNATTCAVCGTADAPHVTDHIQVGTPGVPQHDEGVCEACGKVLDNVVEKYGSQLTLMIDESQREAGDGEITTPR